jgi:hypothetical protein
LRIAGHYGQEFRFDSSQIRKNQMCLHVAYYFTAARG